ncbi:MAG: ElyC/SanA/YdcF family protein [Bacteroidota bacterium]
MKKMMIYGGIGFLLLVLTVAICNQWVLRSTEGQMYSTVDQLPARDVALVLGTIKELPNGRENLYFSNRISAAAALYRSGKVKHFLVSGDNHQRGYNEPEDMQQALMERGIPEEAITLDYAGFRTLDSVVRAKKIFQQDRFVIVSQPFHNHRALFIARRYGIDAIAFNARKVNHLSSTKIKFREILARVKAVLDLYILRKQPKFLGEVEELIVNK